MADDRPFPPSPRRVALARRAGLTATSPLLVGGAACAALLVAMIYLVRAAGSRLAAAIAAACDGRAVLSPGALVSTTLSLALPLLAAGALAALAAHLAQTRSVWLPRRHDIPGAPSLPASRVRRTAFELAAAGIIGAVTFAWLWLLAPRIARLVISPLAAGALVASALTAFTITWLAIATLDALLRHAALARALRMTPAEKREDERLAGIDPRWKRHRAPTRTPSLAAARLLLLGDDVAVAIA